MADKIQWAGNTMPKSDDKHLGIMSLDHVKKARAFHQSFPQYTVTPLARLDGQAARLGLSNLCVKDESYRFGLNAFKVLGGSFAMANYIADETGKDVAECTFDYLPPISLPRTLARPPSLPLPTAIMAAAWHGLPTSWARRPSFTCPRVPPSPASITSPPRAQR